jgi:predicted nucleic acid-binding protein
MRGKYVLDACSLIAHFNQEEGASEVKSIITRAISGDATVLMHRINLFEVYYDLLRSGGEEKTGEAMSEINDFPITIVDKITDALMKEAARFKLSYKISVADAFALATAKTEDATLVSADHHEFDAIDKAGEVPLFWFR